MTDSFFQFDQGHPSDSFPELYRDRSFPGFSDQDPLQFNGQVPNIDNIYPYPPESDSFEPTEHNRNIETMSNYSASSTNCSSKQSPQYNQGEEESKQNALNAQSGQIIKKKIHKYYEPLKDGNVIYRYEEDPVEYKKARK